jgi:hypothetical protein
MKRSTTLAVGFAAVLILGVAIAATAQPEPVGPAMMMHGMGDGPMGPGMMMHGMHPGVGDGSSGPMRGPMAGGMQHADAAFGDDMQLVHAMIFNHDKIKRTVANLPDGIRTSTESEDPQVAQAIKAHVASMEKRLGDGKEFNLFSPTIPLLFENREKIKTVVATTEKGSLVTQTSSDPKVVAALQAHAAEVSELARDGMVAMMRAARASMMSRAAR